MKRGDENYILDKQSPFIYTIYWYLKVSCFNIAFSDLKKTGQETDLSSFHHKNSLTANISLALMGVLISDKSFAAIITEVFFLCNSLLFTHESVQRG
jgi:hypothetical protein